MKRKKDPNRRNSKFTENEMRRAVLMVIESGMTINRVSREEGLCKKTLKSYVDKYLNCAEAKKDVIRFKPNYEINQVFTNDLETMFENHLLALDKTVRKLNRNILRDAAYEFAVKCNVHVPKTWNLRKKAGLDWMYSFLNRHPRVKRTIIRNKKNENLKSNLTETVVEDIVVCGGDESLDLLIEDGQEMDADSGSESHDKKEQLPATRLSDLMRKVTDKYFYSYLKLRKSADGDDLLDDVSVKTPLDEFQEALTNAYNVIACDHLVPSERIYCLDEIALVAENPPYGLSNTVVVTTCCFVNAAGGTAPPFMVFPHRMVKKRTPIGCPEETKAVGSKNGHMDADVFVQALRHLQEATQASECHKIVLIMDNDDCHVTVASIDYCHAHGIELVTVPPHHAKQLLPIGRQPFETLKACFNRAYRKFRQTNPDVFISMHDVGSLFGAVYPYAFTRDKIVSAFQQTGVYPLDKVVLADPNSLVPELDKHDYLAAPVNSDFKLVVTGITESDLETTSDDDKHDTFGSFNSTSELKSPMDEFFENLMNARRVLREHGALRPERIYNMDEVELVVHNPLLPDVRVLACCYASAAGNTIPPFLLYPEEEFDPSALEGGVKGMRAAALPNGSELREVFVILLEYFREYADVSPQNRAMLIVKADASHISVNSMDFVSKNGIELVTVPPQVSEPMQPLEKIAFQSLARNFKMACDRMLTKCGRHVTARDIAPLLKEVYPDTFSNANIRDGFRLTGLWPLNRAKFSKDHELYSMNTEVPPSSKNSTGVSENSSFGNETNEVEESDTGSDWECESGSLLVTNGTLQFFENLVEAFRNLQKTNDLKPGNIYVVGELQLQPASGKDVLVTACCFANALGSTLPPFLVSATRIDEKAVKWAPVDTIVVTSENGRIDNETYLKMLRHFKRHAQIAANKQALLIVDDGAASENDSVAQFCDANGIILHLVPASLSIKLHPLRRSVFEPLTRAIIQDVESERLTQDGDQTVSAECLVAAFGRAYSRAFEPDGIVNTFKECDLVPGSEDEFEEDNEQKCSSESSDSGEPAERWERRPPAQRLNIANTSVTGNPLPLTGAERAVCVWELPFPADKLTSTTNKAFAPERIVDAFKDCDLLPGGENEIKENNVQKCASESSDSGKPTERWDCPPPAQRLNIANTSATKNSLPLIEAEAACVWESPSSAEILTFITREVFASDCIEDAFKECDLALGSEDKIEENNVQKCSSESFDTGEPAERWECRLPVQRLNVANMSAMDNPLAMIEAEAVGLWESAPSIERLTLTTSDSLPLTTASAVPERESLPSAERLTNSLPLTRATAVPETESVPSIERLKTAKMSPTNYPSPITVAEGISERTNPEFANTYPDNIEDFIIEEEIEVTIEGHENNEGTVPNADNADVTVVCAEQFFDYGELTKLGMSYRGCHGGKTFMNNHMIVEHEETGTGRCTYSCQACGKVCDTKEEFIQHRSENILKVIPINKS